MSLLSTTAATSVILPTTLKFLGELVDPEHQDREWFAENGQSSETAFVRRCAFTSLERLIFFSRWSDARYRHALANFTSFIQAWVPLASEADWSLPHLPAKELIQRIYRDVRFSKDKTPYKTNMSASHCVF